MAELFVGAAAALGLYWVVSYARSLGLTVRWWQWVLTLMCTLYVVFVAEVIVSFLREGSPKAAVVTGGILGFVAVVWGVLLGRFVFVRKRVG